MYDSGVTVIMSSLYLHSAVTVLVHPYIYMYNNRCTPQQQVYPPLAPVGNLELYVDPLQS